LIELISL